MLPEGTAVRLHNVFLYHGKKTRTLTAARTFSSLSFRLTGESIFYTKKMTLEVPEESVIFIPSGQSYLRSVKKKETIVVFHFTVYGADLPEITVRKPKDSAKMRELFLEALRLFEEKPNGYRFAATAVFYRILELLSTDGAPSLRAIDGLASRAAALIERRFSDPSLSIASLSEELFVSTAYLRRSFQMRFGMSPKEYLSGVRIKHARALLGAGYYSQKEIAEKCGYCDVKYFRVAFSRETGESPSAYVRRTETGAEN